MSCKHLKTCFIAGEDYTDRNIEFTEGTSGLSNFRYEIKNQLGGIVKEMVPGDGLSILGNIIIIEADALETLSVGQFSAAFWADVNTYTRRIFTEELEISTDGCSCANIYNLSFTIVPVKITEVINQFLDYDSLTPEQKAALKGVKGDKGDPFTIYKSYQSIAEMEADIANVPDGKFVVIASHEEDPDNAKLYLRGEADFVFITDLSGAKGIKGDEGPIGPAPAHQWTGTVLSFQNPDETWAAGVDLKGDQGDEGLSIFYTGQQLSATNGSTALSNINRPDGRNVKVGDLIISTNALSSGRLNIVTSLTATHANNSFLVNLRGIEGLSMYSANVAFDSVSGTLTKSQVNVPSGYSLKTADLVISTHPDTLLRLVRITSMTSTTANYTTVIENAITVEGETIEVGKNLTKEGNVVDVKIEANSISEAIPVNHNNAISITTDRFGNSYVIDFSQNNVSVTDTSGNSSILGNTGAGPRAVAVDDLGNVYTVNINDKNITKITPEGVTTILASFAAISGFIALDPDGNVYTINPSREVLKVTPGGTVSTLGVVGFSPMGIALDLSGNIYTPNAGSNSVSKITPAGTVSTIASVTFARGIATDKLGNVFTASWTENTLFKITPAGVKTTLTNLLDAPSLLAIHNDIVYVGSENNGKIFKVYPNGDTELMANLAGNSQGIDVDFAGNLYVLNGMPRTIIKFPAPNRRKLALNANDEIIRVGSYSLAEEFTGDMWINGKEIFRKVIVDGAAYPADIDALIREQTVGGHVILEYTKI